jgi:hypothetical protein
MLGIDGYGGGCKGSYEEDGELHVGGVSIICRRAVGRMRGYVEYGAKEMEESRYRQDYIPYIGKRASMQLTNGIWVLAIMPCIASEVKPEERAWVGLNEARRCGRKIRGFVAAALPKPKQTPSNKHIL